MSSHGLGSAIVLLPLCALSLINLVMYWTMRLICILQTSYMIEMLVAWAGAPNTKQGAFEVVIRMPCQDCLRLECDGSVLVELPHEFRD